MAKEQIQMALMTSLAYEMDELFSHARGIKEILHNAKTQMVSAPPVSIHSSATIFGKGQSSTAPVKGYAPSFRH